MNRSIVIGIKGTAQSVIGCGLGETEAMKVASESTGFDCVEVYINPAPFSVMNCKAAKKKPAKKKAAKSAKAKK